MGVVAKTFPVDVVKSVLDATGQSSRRQRELQGHLVIYYVIALALYMQSSYREVLRCLLEGIQWLFNPSARIKVTGKSGISQAQTRLGVEPVKQLHDQIVGPIATEATKGAWYRGWRVVSLDGSTLDVADEDANDEAFGRPLAQRGKSAFPQMRFVSLVENGTHVLFGTQMGGYRTGELTLAKGVLPWSEPRYAVPGGPLFLSVRVLAASPSYGGPNFSGGSERTCAWPASSVWLTVRT